MKHIVHVAHCAIRANAKDGGLRPPTIIRNYRGAKRTLELTLREPKTGKVLGRMVYSPHKPLGCGARLWLEFDDATVVLDPGS